MKKRSTHFAALLCAGIIACSAGTQLAPAASFAAVTETDDYIYNEFDDYVNITSFADSAAINVPAQINGKPVRVSDGAFYSCPSAAKISARPVLQASLSL